MSEIFDYVIKHILMCLKKNLASGGRNSSLSRIKIRLFYCLYAALFL